MPFDGKDLADDEDFQDMKEEIYDFQQDLEDYLKDASDNKMRVLYIGNGISMQEVQGYLLQDLCKFIQEFMTPKLFIFNYL